MRGLGKACKPGARQFQRGGDKAPLPPAAFDPARGEGHVGIVLQRRADPLTGRAIGASVEMDHHEIARRRQARGLGDDPLGILVTQQQIGDPGQALSSGGA